MKRLTSFYGIAVGEVLLCEYDLKDKQTGKPYTWRWFGVVIRPRINTARLYRLGAEEGRNPETEVDCLTPSRRRFMLLDPDEWPDGVHVMRMRAILQGQIDLD